MSEVLNGTRASPLTSGVPPSPPGSARTEIGDPAERPIRSRRPRVRARSSAARAWRRNRPCLQVARPAQWIASTQPRSRRVGRTRYWAPGADCGFDPQELRPRAVTPVQRTTYRSRVFLRSRRLGGSHFGYEHRNGNFNPRGILETDFSRLDIPRLREGLVSSSNGIYNRFRRLYESGRSFHSGPAAASSFRGHSTSYFTNVSLPSRLDESSNSNDTDSGVFPDDIRSRDSPSHYRVLPVSSSESFSQEFWGLPLGHSAQPSCILPSSNEISSSNSSDSISMAEHSSPGVHSLSSDHASVSSTDDSDVSVNQNAFNSENDSMPFPDSSSNDVTSVSELTDTDSSLILNLPDSDATEWDDEILSLQSSDFALSLASSEGSIQSTSTDLSSVEGSIEFHNFSTCNVEDTINSFSALLEMTMTYPIVNVPTSGPGIWLANAAPSYKISRMGSHVTIVSRATELPDGSWELQSSFPSQSNNALDILPIDNTSNHWEECPICDIERKSSQTENSVQCWNISNSDNTSNTLQPDTQQCEHNFNVPPQSVAIENSNTDAIFYGTGDVDFEADLLSWPPYLRDMAYNLCLDPSDFNWDDVNIDSTDTLPDSNLYDA